MIDGKHGGQGIYSTKMGADISAENTPNAPKSLGPKLSAQAQKFGIFEKSSDSYLCTLMIGYNVLKYFIPFFKWLNGIGVNVWSTF